MRTRRHSPFNTTAPGFQAVHIKKSAYKPGGPEIKTETLHAMEIYLFIFLFIYNTSSYYKIT